MGNKILLLGANGYVGKYLSSVFDVIPITRNDCNLTDIVVVKKLIKLYKPDIILNCAANVNLEKSPFNYNHFIDNINIFFNLYSLKDDFGKLINFGSGAEFDRKTSIDNALEQDILRINPSDHYGLSKNIISNVCLTTENFYTLRLFGCLHHTEHPNKLFKKIVTNKNIILQDSYFDYIWMEDLFPIVNYFLHNSPEIKDINLVYNKKFLLSELINKFIAIHNLDAIVNYEKSALNYTGSSVLIDSFNFPLNGIEYGLEKYKI
jgi:GDP-L-fucose synthase